MSSDLIDQLGVDPQDHPLPLIKDKTERANKICFLSAGLTWLIHVIEIKGQFKSIYVNNRLTPEIELDL